MGAPPISIRFKPTKKQQEAVKYLYDDVTREIVFGGGAGGAKSFLGSIWLLTNCLSMPGSRWLMARKELKTLKESTLLTFFDVCTKYGVFAGQHYTYNQNDGIVKFWNGSLIFLGELIDKPTDPNFDRLGSKEFTGAFIDEVAEISAKAKTVVRSRCRYRLKDWDMHGRPTADMKVARYHPETGEPDAWYTPEGRITEGRIPKVLMSCNPCKNFPYIEFYKPWRDKTMPSDRAFIQALVHDNPHAPKSYIESLQKMDKATRERLLNGNWEYDDDPDAMLDFDAICDLWTNDFVEDDKMYMTADVAAEGSDKFVIGIWSGLRLIHIETLEKNDGKQGRELMHELRKRFRIPMSNICYDSDGVGSMYRGDFPGATAFVNNGTPIGRIKGKPVNYQNLKTQCAYELAKRINAREIYISFTKHRDEIIEELEQLKKFKSEVEAKLRIKPKEEVKKILGHSPDFLDMMIMRMLFLIKPQTKASRVGFI